MIITNEAYHNLIQIQWESRKKQLLKDPERTRTDWFLRLSRQLGELATEINDQCTDPTLLQRIISVAETLRSWYWLETEEKESYPTVIGNERHHQDQKWGPQHHTRNKWYIIAAEEAGEIAQAIEDNLDDKHLIHELIQTAAVLQAWCTSHDWFYEPDSPHTTHCKNCNETFETQPGDIIRCPDCHQTYFMDGRTAHTIVTTIPEIP